MMRVIFLKLIIPACRGMRRSISSHKKDREKNTGHDIYIVHIETDGHWKESYVMKRIDTQQHKKSVSTHRPRAKPLKQYQCQTHL